MKVFEFITSENWCQKSLCIDNNGVEQTWPYSASCIKKWDLGGMILYCYRSDELQQAVLEKVKAAVGGHIPRWNDSPDRTWEHVRDLAKSLDI